VVTCRGLGPARPCRHVAPEIYQIITFPPEPSRQRLDIYRASDPFCPFSRQLPHIFSIFSEYYGDPTGGTSGADLFRV
jgi:hypothetical protein